MKKNIVYIVSLFAIIGVMIGTISTINKKDCAYNTCNTTVNSVSITSDIDTMFNCLRMIFSFVAEEEIG